MRIIDRCMSSLEYAQISKRIALQLFFVRSFELDKVISQDVAICLAEDWGVYIDTYPSESRTLIRCDVMHLNKGRVNNELVFKTCEATAVSCRLLGDYASNVAKMIEMLICNVPQYSSRWFIADEEQALTLAQKLAWDFGIHITIARSDFYYTAVINLNNVTSGTPGTVNGVKVTRRLGK